MSLRRIALIAALLAALVGPQALAADRPPRKRAQTPPGSFLVSGRGWGHGVGLSQWGAYGFARQGVAYDRILAHYYQGTTLGPAPLSRVRVLLVPGRARVTISSESPFRVQDALGNTFALKEGPHAFGPGLQMRVNNRKKPNRLTGPLTFLPGASPLRLDRPYRGQLVVASSGGKVRVVNHVGLEAYLFGVVPGEMPFYWVPEALKAQAVAARTYAMAVRKSGSDFDLYPDVRSQVYGGIKSERASTTAAVQATSGKVVLYQGRIATTYFFSTSGGRTASVADVWPGSPRVPYLVSVEDPYDSLSPHHQWGPFAVQNARLAKVLGVSGRLLDVRLDVGPSGRVRNVTGVGTVGEVAVTGADVRRALGLRSTWFRIGLLFLYPPTAPVTYNTNVTLTGVARGLSAVTLEQRPAGGTAWKRAATARAGRDGAVSVTTKPRETGEYRLVANQLRSAPITVQVAPLLRFYAMPDPTTLRGYARPILPGAPVVIQRQDGAAWRNVVQAPVDANGDFQVTFDITPGTYRARLAPGRRFAPGVSPVLRVGPA